MRIGIVGAGPAGLRAAQLLEQKGALVQVFEARDRVGGRLHTISLPEGGFYEAGGEWIDKDHRRVLEVMSEHGLEPEVSRAWPGQVVWRGDVRQEDQLWPDAEQDAEAVHEEAVRLCSQIKSPPWESRDLEHLDRQTLADFLDHHCISEGGRWWTEAMFRSDEGEDTSEIGLLGWLVGYQHYLEREAGDMSLYRIPGGAGALCEKMAEGLRAPIHLGHVLRSVSPTETHVELWFEGEMAFCDKVILALPPKVLQGIDFGDSLPVEKEAAWHLLGSSRTIKVALRFDRDWWSGDGRTGRLMTDLPCQQIWSSGREGAHVLCAYIGGNAAIDVLASRDPVGRVLRSLAEVWPEASASFVEGWVHDWVGDPFAQGAFSHFSPGGVMTALPRLVEPVGRVHFAGESTARWMGFIEGAFESAERVVEEVLGQ